MQIFLTILNLRKKLDDETETALKAALEEFKTVFNAK